LTTQKELLNRLFTDPIFYIENFLYISTKDGSLTKLKLNKIQRELVEYVVDCLKREVPIRAIILKARQEGVSTVIEAVIFWFTATRKHISSRIMAHDGKATDNLFAMFKRYNDNLHPALQPMMKYSNKKELQFSNPSTVGRKENPGLDSRISVSTAGSKEAGRSETNQLMHGSETAFWDNPDEVMAGMLQTIPMAKNTMVFLESTANGVGGYFYEAYQKAKQGESGFKAFFFPWWDHEEYAITPDKGFKLTEEEKEIKETLKITNAQMNWRRMKKAELAGTKQKFEQEYPADDMEAFISSGRPRFDIELLKDYLKNIKPYVQGDLHKRRFTTSDRGYLKVWEKPFQKAQYVIGVDVAEGLETGDNSVIQVLDRKTTRQVAEFCGKIDPDKLGEYCYYLGRWYNDAFVGVESNNHGLTTLTILKQMLYPNLYYRRIMDDKRKKQTTKMGWHTNIKTKPLMIDEMSIWIREGLIKFNSKELIEECMTYVIEPNGATNAQTGCHDDRVTSMAIALQMYKLISTDLEEDPMIKFSGTNSRR
jgi:hypothetical protein